MTKPLRRRDFLRLAATAAIVRPAAAARRDAPLRVAVVGVRGRGSEHIRAFKALPGVTVHALCDVDGQVLSQRKEQLAREGLQVETFADVRDLLARSDVDVVSLATPNHLHALHTAWACEAGKDVYVEKPVSHNLWEGRRMVEIARRTGRIVQAGTQARSSPAVREAIAWVHAGGLGAPRYAQAICYKPRRSIGRVTLPLDPPVHVRHDLWSGPREPGPVGRAQYHYDWHWQWAYGNGDLGNQGVHQVDVCRWMLGARALPRRVLTVGGRFGYADDGTTPNTLVAYLDLEPAPLLFEVRGLPKDLAAQAQPDWGAHMDRVAGATIAALLHAEQGRLLVTADYSLAVAQDHAGNELRRWKANGDHFANFIDAVRARDVGLLHADVEEGHISAGYCHLANDAHRLGERDTPGAVLSTLEGAPLAHEAATRAFQHLALNGVDLERDAPTFGRALQLDPLQERYVGDQAAESLRRGTYRAGFTLPT